MKKNRIVFRADGNTIAGYGHVIRSLSLASILSHKYKCVFIIQAPDIFLRTQIKTVCDELIEIPSTKNLTRESKILSKKIIKSNDIVVLDGYNFDTDYQSQIKKHCFKLVCIDDIHTNHFIANVVINHGEGIKAENYSKENYTKLYLGIHFAILRKSFLKKRPNHFFDSVFGEHIFINMGGTDQKNYTEKALRTCLKNKNVKTIDIVIGSFYSHIHKLQNIIVNNKNVKIKIHSNLSEQKMYSLMKRSTIAICSASTVSYEYASVGGVLFIYQTVSNQKNIYSFLIQSGSAFDAKAFNQKFSQFKNKKVREQYFEKRKKYFSGNSDKNLLSIFDTLELERSLIIRPAQTDDVIQYHKWANDIEVRKNSIHTDTILFKDHKQWFNFKLKNKNALLYIIEKNKMPLGQVRFDRKNKIAEIDYSVSSVFRGKGYGEIILKNTIILYFHKFKNDTIAAKVKQSNYASNRVFSNLGFKKLNPSSIKRIKYNNYLLSPPHQ